MDIEEERKLIDFVKNEVDYGKSLFTKTEMLGGIFHGDNLIMSYAYALYRGDDYAQKVYKEYLESKRRKKKYAWHDLQKNPEDLPDELDDYDLLIDDKVVINKPRIMMGYYNKMSGRWSILSPYITNHNTLGETEFILPDYCDVLAWREIEP